MNYFSMHPNVYSTDSVTGLIQMLERAWIHNVQPGIGTIYIVSGFANFNGGVRFYDVLEQHITKGGKVIAIFGGSTSQRLASKQVVNELLTRGVEVHIVNRKRLVHSKLYGYSTKDDSRLVVSSGNFTGPGMSQNVESSVFLDSETLTAMQFKWEDLIKAFFSQNWQFHKATNSDKNPIWDLLYDEQKTNLVLDDTDKNTLLQTLVSNDTTRITGKVKVGSLYFFLSKQLFDFFPPLTIRNKRGFKPTYSALITINFLDLNISKEMRITFEAENNLDFRLGVGPLRNTNIAKPGDLFALERISETEYNLRIFSQKSKEWTKLEPYCINFIGHKGKKYGMISNEEFENLF
ncbi:restriction endonuclease [Enterococcus faecium]|uniref:phospholipase D-like domain-containing protein n=1 Tax=Enterococcus TaxID=1350 RepID=UPI0008A1F4C3|nr:MULTISPECIES: phospholipase D-like domain-containing protein [Enterococcus]EGP4766635.1 restriction endonuclease [Enterococcus faecium]EGP4864359.1 restriction endonuclease [Enterococcus faecium]EGP5145083.1 restriction endonuclease [Enterococcus faecium]EGP5247640.1 restriction endonuclease [Enterococcus faecium]EGP5393375.1 restriction endonuclease [Enterococcus faecium]